MRRQSSLKIWVGTRKGAFAFSSIDRKKWTVDGPFFAGEEVHHVAQDPRDPRRYYAAAGNPWIGPHLHASTDRGKTWKLSENGLAVKDLPDATTLKRIWHIAPGADDEPGVVYVGADPGVLFRSPDNGANWQMVSGLCNHPTRAKWTPGAGGMMVHSIQCLGKGRLIVGISAAGAFRSNDSGQTWEPFNANVRADFLPNKFPEVGQCVHKLKAHPLRPSALYQQNHCGTYRADFGDKKWTDISKSFADSLRFWPGRSRRRGTNPFHSSDRFRRAALRSPGQVARRAQPRWRTHLETPHQGAAAIQRPRAGAARSNDLRRSRSRGHLLRHLHRARCSTPATPATPGKSWRSIFRPSTPSPPPCTDIWRCDA